MTEQSVTVVTADTATPSLSVEVQIADQRWHDVMTPSLPVNSLSNACSLSLERHLEAICNRAWDAAWAKGLPGGAFAEIGHDLSRLPSASLVFEAAMKLTSDQELHRLNKEFRGKDQPTNVLSFPSGELFEQDLFTSSLQDREIFLGDVAMSIDTVMREAKVRAIEPVDHMTHLAIHAILHLLGWTHDTAQNALAMETLEVEILNTLGIANPYQAGNN